MWGKIIPFIHLFCWKKNNLGYLVEGLYISICMYIYKIHTEWEHTELSSDDRWIFFLVVRNSHLGKKNIYLVPVNWHTDFTILFSLKTGEVVNS